MCIEFIKNNKTTIKIDSIDFQYSLNYLTKDQIEQIFENGSWENYHKIYGFRPMVQVSRPGLNSGKNKALIYYSTSTDGLSARGFYVILEKTKDGWIVKEIMLSWMS
jgi:hypothetical protein